ncbi:hypothetical protein ACFQHV_16075 [Promicromonospora thailandica]|uniref:Polysaccharide pyruvyl transferase family protein WcaK n=1 Tax=Promicromonospora thailandica TaxID=765201 RepID=A0A9X2G8P6_9MICO|nr:hypothetical protein [Promicromonospora thailandica]MCP2264686.1 Polysaccharide pyruvyl transferase family protein WcaK [Promicromonospora thailandica]BFF20234.1 hypothetical protein GCM10025730_37550 [Promicromonospora thailandica]
MSGPAPQIFLWLTGQEDNVGDSALRRPYARALADAGPVTAWCGGPGTGYQRGLALPPDVTVSRSLLRWWTALVASGLRRPTVLAFNAGEFDVTKAYLVGVVALLPLLPLIRLRGGSVIWVGAGVRRRRRGLMWPFGALARLADVLVWRDDRSGALLRAAPAMPDWAFALPPGGLLEERRGSGDRDCVVVSLRSDRPMPSPGWIASVGRLARRLSAEVVVVAQVERDDARARHVGRLLGATVVGWSSADHAVQERALRDVYRRAHVVVSDRLHVLVLAATEGAVPLGWCEQATEKIASHFAVVGAEWAGPGADGSAARLDTLDAATVNALSRRTATAVRDAAAEVRRTAHHMGSVISARADGVRTSRDTQPT